MAYVEDGSVFAQRRAACPGAAIVLALFGATTSPAVAQSGPRSGAVTLSVPAPPPAPFRIPAPPPPPPRIAPTLTEAQAALLRKMLADAPSHGIGTVEQARASQALSGAALVNAALVHAVALRGGSLSQTDYLKIWGLRPAFYEPWPSFVDAVARDRLAAWIAALPPPYTGYDNLRRGLAAYRAIVAKGGWERLVEGTDLKPGAKGARVLALRRRLAVEDSGVAAIGDSYDAELTDAVRRAQKRYGLEPTGSVGPQTLAALNVPASERVGQILANMERWRWLPPELPTNRIQVNIAAAVLTVFSGDAPVLSMRAVTGRPGDETPMLQSKIHSVVFNPPWNVPTSIATKELWPKERANPGYLARNGFKVIKTPDGGSRLQQAAGDKSALGRFKFDFDNPYSVYLHDTPSQATFDRYARMVSHGCVRLQRPADLARLVLQGDERWAGDAIDATVAAGKTVRAKLPDPVSVYLLYWTAYASANGQMSFRADPYSWDSLLAARIEAKAAAPQFATTAR